MRGRLAAGGLAGAATAGALAAALVFAQQPEDFDASWGAAAPGGTSTGGAFVLTGAVGQAVAGRMEAGPYELTGGLFAIPMGAVVGLEFELIAPGVAKDSVQ